VPLGTANDFAVGCGIPPDPEKALALCLKGQVLPIDIGKANEHWFLNVASVGFGAEVDSDHSRLNSNACLALPAYTVMGAILAMNFHHYHGRLTSPDREITGSGPIAIVGNGRQTGGGGRSLRCARIDDGCSDVLVVVRSRRCVTHRRARVQELSPDGEYISYWANTVGPSSTPKKSIPVNLDGEPVRFSSVRYEAVPRAIRLIVPPNCPLLSATS